ncbi:MAG: hypothetical protein Q8K32_09450 [Archangium sp.]|nr:hypothetical protein [Archangium sp.]
MKFRTSRAALFFGLVAAACFDPLYEEGAHLTPGWVLCCPSGVVDTCFCESASSCQPEPVACAGGRCAAVQALCTLHPNQDAGIGGGNGAGGGGAGAGGGSGGGAGTGGGAAGGGGGTADSGVYLDAGVVDAGLSDAGAGGGSGGGTGGGSGGGTGGGTGGGSGGGTGGGTSTSFEFCCLNARVTTCACPLSGCTNSSFTPCPGGGCVPGSNAEVCR